MLPERPGSKDSEHWSLLWWECSDEVLLKQVLTVRHHSQRQFYRARVKLRPGVEDTIPYEGNMANYIIRVGLGMKYVSNKILI